MDSSLSVHVATLCHSCYLLMPSYTITSSCSIADSGCHEDSNTGIHCMPLVPAWLLQLPIVWHVKQPAAKDTICTDRLHTSSYWNWAMWTHHYSLAEVALAAKESNSSWHAYCTSRCLDRHWHKHFLCRGFSFLSFLLSLFHPPLLLFVSSHSSFFSSLSFFLLVSISFSFQEG